MSLISDVTGAVKGAVDLSGSVNVDVSAGASAGTSSDPSPLSGGALGLGALLGVLNQASQAVVAPTAVPLGPAAPTKTITLRLKSAPATGANAAAASSQAAAADAEAAQATQLIAASQSSVVPMLIVGAVAGATLGVGLGAFIPLFKWPIGVLAGTAAGAISGWLYNAFAPPGATTFGYEEGDFECDDGFDADYGSDHGVDNAFGPPTVFSLKG